VPVYSWTEVAAELRRLAERIPPGQTVDPMVFGGTVLQHWGMEGRLTRDIDVQLSKSSPNLQGLMPALTPAVQFGVASLKGNFSTLRPLRGAQGKKDALDFDSSAFHGSPAILTLEILWTSRFYGTN
jgi:hypothetical protein